jgi:hypothetical protein
MKRTEPRRGYDDTARGWVGVPHAKTETSKDAAKKIAPRAHTLRREVLELVHARGGRGATAYEVADALKRPVSSIVARFYELRKMGLLIKNNEARLTPNGGRSRVHIAEGWGDEPCPEEQEP